MLQSDTTSNEDNQKFDEVLEGLDLERKTLLAEREKLELEKAQFADKLVAESNYRRKFEQLQKILILIILLILLVAGSYFIFWGLDNQIAVALLSIGIAGLAALSPKDLFGGKDTQEEIRAIRQERKELKGQFLEKDEKDVFDTIQLNLNLLSEYYTINIGQAKSSFRFSIVAILIGLTVLILGIAIFYFREDPNVQLASISGISGVFIQFIGGANFYIYTRSIRQLNYFYAQLVKTQETMLAIKLCEQLSEKNKQIEIMEKLILSLIERSSIADKVLANQGKE